MSTFEITLAITIAIANAIAVAIFVLYRTKQRSTTPTASDSNAPPLSQLAEDQKYIRELVNRTHSLTSQEDRLKNIQKMYEYLILHPSLLIHEPILRNVFNQKAAEAQSFLSQKPYYSSASELSRVLESYYTTLLAISILPSYVK